MKLSRRIRKWKKKNWSNLGFFGGTSPQCLPPPNCNFDLKMVSKNCANFVLNYAAIFKFCAVRHFAECRGGAFGVASPHCEFRRRVRCRSQFLHELSINFYTLGHYGTRNNFLNDSCAPQCMSSSISIINYIN